MCGINQSLKLSGLLPAGKLAFGGDALISIMLQTLSAPAFLCLFWNQTTFLNKSISAKLLIFHVLPCDVHYRQTHGSQLQTGFIDRWLEISRRLKRKERDRTEIANWAPFSSFKIQMQRIKRNPAGNICIYRRSADGNVQI